MSDVIELKVFYWDGVPAFLLKRYLDFTYDSNNLFLHIWWTGSIVLTMMFMASDSRPLEVIVSVASCAVL